MKLIVGLGNPGKKYEDTRHNVGHWFIEELRARNFQLKAKVVKSSVFVNQSGKEVLRLTKAHQVDPGSLLVVHDDLDLEPGAWKLQFGRSAAGHKGVLDVIEKLGTKGFWRLRLGVGRPKGDGERYVLSPPEGGEKELIEEAIEESVPRVLQWIEGDIE